MSCKAHQIHQVPIMTKSTIKYFLFVFINGVLCDLFLYCTMLPNNSNLKKYVVL